MLPSVKEVTISVVANVVSSGMSCGRGMRVYLIPICVSSISIEFRQKNGIRVRFIAFTSDAFVK